MEFGVIIFSWEVKLFAELGRCSGVVVIALDFVKWSRFPPVHTWARHLTLTRAFFTQVRVVQSTVKLIRD